MHCCRRKSFKIFLIILLVCFFYYIVPFNEINFFSQNEKEIQKLLEQQLDLYKVQDVEELEKLRNSFDMELHEDESDQDTSERACKIPRINPYELSALKLIRAQTTRRALKEPKCITNPSFMFISDNLSKITKVREPRTEKVWRNTRSCCYVPFTTNENYDKIINLSSCIPITEEITTIPQNYSNINVLCSNHEELTYRDYFHFFRLDPEIEKKLETKEKLTRSDGSDHLSLIFFGLDSVSLTNFQRFLPKTRNYLVKNMSAFEFYGLNKVGRGTIENVVPAFTGCSYVDGKTIFPSAKEDCYLIWEKFKEKGYRTALSEEQFWLTAYREIKRNNNGTHSMDYTNLPFVKGIGNWVSYALWTYGCFEHQFAPKFMADRVKQIARQLKDKLYYHHLWSVLTTHEVIEYAKYLDDPLFDLMQALHEEELLNNTLLVLYSDHGTVSSDYSRTAEGLIEARLPLLYMVFPQWFKKKYSKAMKNLKQNTKALISPFDVYETINELLDLNKVHDSQLTQSGKAAKPASKFGISLFREIPINRTCESAHIPEEYCVCWKWTQLDNPNQDFNVIKAVSFTLDSMNKIIDDYPDCKRLDLERILHGKKRTDVWGNVVYEISFQVIPSHGKFGANVKVLKVGLDGEIQFKIIGEIERQNLYKGQSNCLSKRLQETGWIRSACYCKSN